MERWTPIAGCVGQAEGTHITWADHCAELEYAVDDAQKHACKMAKERDLMMVERNNAEKQAWEILGRANALEAELKATQRRLDTSDELLREEFAKRQDAYAVLRDIGDFAHDRSTGPAVEDDLWEVRRMAYELLTPNAELTGACAPMVEKK